MNKRGISTILLSVIMISIIAIASVSVVSYYYLGKSPSETVEGVNDSSSEPDASEPDEKVSSLQFTTEQLPDYSTDDSSFFWENTTGVMTGYLKNIDTDNLKLRMEVSMEGQVFMMLIANGQQNKAWIWSVFSNSWMDISNDFETQWANAKMVADEIMLGLSKGTLDEFNYTDPATNETQTFKIAEYQVNPILEDSLFEIESTGNTTGGAEQGYASVVVWGDYADRTNERAIIVYGNAENTGTKNAQNCRLEIAVVFEIDNITQTKTEFVTLGDIPSGTVNEFIATIQLPIGVNPAMTGYSINVWYD